MGTRFHNSIALAKASWGVLRDDKKLVVLPVLSGLASLIVLASFGVPALLVGNSSGVGPAVWLLTFIAYVALAFVVIFFNAALVFAADRRLKGQPVSIGEALQDALSKAHVLLPWAVVSATVSIILRALEDRAGIFGRIVIGLIGAAWSVVTFLVLPILVFEGIGPISAIKRSGSLFKKTWGENIIANGAIGLLALGAILIGAIPCVLLIAAGGPAMVVGIALAVIWIVAVQLVASTLTGILQTALYRFATNGEVIGFDQQMLRGAYRTRDASPARTWLN